MKETAAPDGMPVESKANAGELFMAGRQARRAFSTEGACPYSIADNRDRWREGWRFEDGLIRSQAALASFDRATAKETDMQR